MNSIKLFISYAHEDKTYFNSLKKGIIEHKSFIEEIDWHVWDDGEISIGQEWHKVIQSEIKNCNIAILLISPAFFNSKYIKFEEFTKFIERVESEDNFTLFPIVIRDCRYDRFEKLAKYQLFLPKGDKFGFPDIKDLAYSFLVNDSSKGSYLDRYHLQLVDVLESTLKRTTNLKTIDTQKKFYGLESIYKEISNYENNYSYLKEVLNAKILNNEHQICIKLYEEICCEIFSSMTKKRKYFNFQSLSLSTLITVIFIRNIHNPKYSKLDDALNASIAIVSYLDEEKKVCERYKNYFNQVISNWSNRLVFDSTLEEEINLDENIIVNIYLLVVILISSSKKFALEVLPLERHLDLLSSLVNLPHPTDIKFSSNNLIQVETSAYDISQFIILNLIRYYLDLRLDQVNESFNSFNREFPVQYNHFKFMEQPENWNVQSFTADTTKVINILMGKELYGENSYDVWFREIFQNAIDACNGREKIDISYKEKKILISNFNNKFIIKDNGIGMSTSHISRYFCKVGRSIWRSEDLKKLEQAKDTSNIKNTSNIMSIGKFGVGFLSAFQVSKNIIINTCFCLEDNSSTLKISDVNEPFFIEKSKGNSKGTEIVIEFANNYDFNLTKVANSFLVYNPSGISIEGLDMLPKDANEAIELMKAKKDRDIYKWYSSKKYLEKFEATLNIAIPLTYKNLKDLDSRIIDSKIKVTNGGILIYSPSTTWLGVDYPNPNNKEEVGANGVLGILDFVQGKAPLTVSRNKLSLSDSDARAILSECRNLICDCWEEYALEIRESFNNDLDFTESLLKFLKNSAKYDYSPHSWDREFAKYNTFNDKAKELLIELGHATLFNQENESKTIVIPIQELLNDKSRKITIVIKQMFDSPLFKVFSSQTKKLEVLVVEDQRDARLLSSLNLNWTLILDSKDLWRNIKIEEIRNWKLCDIIQSEFAIVPSSFFQSEDTFITVLPNRRLDVSLLDLPRSRVNNPPRILINQGNKITVGLENLEDISEKTELLKGQFKLLHLCLDEKSSGKRRSKNYQSIIDKFLQIALLPKGLLANLEI